MLDRTCAGADEAEFRAAQPSRDCPPEYGIGRAEWTRPIIAKRRCTRNDQDIELAEMADCLNPVSQLVWQGGGDLSQNRSTELANPGQLIDIAGRR